MVTLLLDDSQEGEPSAEGCKLWIDTHGLENVYVLADPMFSMVVGGSVGTPQMTVVDPRTMKVVFRDSTGGEYPPILETLAQTNSSQ